MSKIDLHELVKQQEHDYTQNKVTRGKYVEFSMYDTIETIDAYLNSKHISGPFDSLGREKPFFNIVVATSNIWMRATDLDRKDVRMLPDSSEDVAVAFLCTVVLQQWMNTERFGVFLNDWGRTSARYGGAVPKFLEVDGRLIPSIVPWNRMICDPIDFYAAPRIEKFYKTPAQLKNMATPGHPDYVGYKLDEVEKLCTAYQELQTRKTLDDRQQDTNNDYIGLYEVHDVLPDYLLKDEDETTEDDESVTDVTYVQQMQVITYLEVRDDDMKKFTLYKGRESKDPYMITSLLKEDGRTLGIGAVEYLFDAQWMQNHTMKNMKDTLDLSSKLIFQTADGNYTGRNVLSAVETGDIMIHDVNKPLTQINNGKADVTQLLSFSAAWMNLGNEITNTPEAMRGSKPTAGTAARLQALVTQQSQNLFDLMRQNKALDLEDMLREYIIPFLKKKLNNKKEIVAILDEQGIQEIDAMFVPKEAVRRHNDAMKQALLNAPIDRPLTADDLPKPFDAQAGEAAVRADLKPLGNKRFLKPDEIGEATWKKALKGFEGRVVVDIDGEATDTQTMLQTLSSTLATIAKNPMILQDPNAKLLFNKILTETGALSPLQLTIAEPSPAAQPTITPSQPVADSPTPTASPPSGT